MKKQKKRVDWREVPVGVVLGDGDRLVIQGPAKIRGRILIGARGSLDLIGPGARMERIRS